MPRHPAPYQAMIKIWKVALLFLSLSSTLSLATEFLISHPGATPTTGLGNSSAPTFSRDGRFVAFVSDARNVVTNASPSPWLEVYMHDLETGRTELVSAGSGGSGGGNGNSSHPTISSNGQFVVFESDASNLVSNDTNGMRDVFLRDMAAGLTVCISLSTNGGNAAYPSRSPLISSDGGQIIFESSAWNLVTNDLNQGLDILVVDRESGRATPVSVNADGTGTAESHWPWPWNRNNSKDAAISADGFMVAFYSDATNLVAGFTNTLGGIFARDIRQNLTHWASKDVEHFTSTNYAQLGAYPPALSSDGQFVFMRVTSSSGRPMLLRYDVETSSTALIASNLLAYPAAAFSSDGRFVAVATTNSLRLLDTDNGNSQIICGDGLMPELMAWRSPAISANGERVSFAGARSPGQWSAYVYDRISNGRQLVSITTNGQPADINALSDPVISPDGQRVAFETRAANLVERDLNRATDIFVRELDRGATLLLSGTATASSTPALRSTLGVKSVSEFGRVIAFSSLDPALANDADNLWHTVLIRDRLNGTYQALATDASRALGTNRVAFRPQISANGRYAAWLEHPALLHHPTPVLTNVFWLDLQTGHERTIAVVPHQFGGDAFALSRDGRWIVFTDRIAGSPYLQVFRQDMFDAGSTNELVSMNLMTGIGAATGNSHTPFFTEDGRWILYLQEISSTAFLVARELTTGQWHFAGHEFGYPVRLLSRSLRASGNSRYIVMQGGNSFERIYRHDLKTRGQNNLLVCTNCSSPAIDDDGEVIVFQQRNASGYFDVYERDLRNDQTTLITSNVLGGPLPGGNHHSFAPIITGDGRYVVFASRASNLVTDDTNGATDVFVHDRTTRTTMLISRNLAGQPGRGGSSSPVLSPDGRTILFSSSADDLMPDDFNNARDVFALHLGSADSDLDGMDDEWELAAFHSLDRHGGGDLDSDGAADRQEFLAGTDPTNTGSIFRLIKLERTEGNGRRIFWQALAGRSYRVQFKNDVNDPFWEELCQVTASASTASTLDEGAIPQRIYRVTVVP
jgi:Tol biopolymer transport system component